MTLFALSGNQRVDQPYSSPRRVPRIYLHGWLADFEPEGGNPQVMETGQ